MERKIMLARTMLALMIAVIVFSAFGYFQNSLFYYAFREKIPLQTVSGQFVVRYSDSVTAKANITVLQRKNHFSVSEWKDERTALVTLTRSGLANAVEELQDGPGVKSVQPLLETIENENKLAPTDEILVRFKKETDAGAIASLLKKYNLSVMQKGELFHTLTIPAKANTLQLANLIMESGLAEFSHPNFYRDIIKNQVPNDEYFTSQWNLNNYGQVINDGHTGTPGADIDAPEAWNTTQGSSSIVIAVLDEGVTSAHPDLPNSRQVRLNGSNFSTSVPGNDPSPAGNGNHGNACSGIIAATRNNSIGIAGIAPNCKIMPIKILNPSASDANIASAITFAKNNGAQILSNSWSYNSSNSNLVPAIVTAINDAVTTGRGGLGCVVVFAAGNTANHAGSVNGTVNFPGNVNISGVLTVGASDRYDKQANYSPTSNTAIANNQVVDIVAPSHRAYPSQITGEDFEIWSIDIPGTAGYNPQSSGVYLPSSGSAFNSYTGRMGGTSAACPQVAAGAALLLSLNSSLTQQQVFTILTENADKTGGYTYNTSGFSNELGFGRLNLYRAVQKATADLYMKDQTTDSGIEPNTSTGAYYASPDIWIRNANDGGTTHQNPEYGQINYVYVKVRNRGFSASAASGNQLKVYWAKASTGLSWTFPWTGSTYGCAGTNVSIGGTIGTQAISSISSGSSTTLVFAWTPPKPSDYTPCFGSDDSHFCLLARIQTSSASPYGMAFPETTDLGGNVKKNNNIVWKNVSVVNVLPDQLIINTSVLITGSKFLRRNFTTTDINFLVPNEKGNNNILEAGNLYINLGDFTDLWLRQSGKAEGGELYKNRDGKTVIKLTASKGTIYGVPVNPDQIGSITLTLEPLKLSAGNLYLFDIQQVDGRTVIGGERFDFQVKEKTLLTAKAATSVAGVQAAQPAMLKAWQNGSQLLLQMNDGIQYNVAVFNASGVPVKHVNMTNSTSISTAELGKGIYFIRVTGVKTKASKSAKVMIQ